jgi:hypothetical protein
MKEYGGAGKRGMGYGRASRVNNELKNNRKAAKSARFRKEIQTADRDLFPWQNLVVERS